MCYILSIIDIQTSYHWNRDEDARGFIDDVINVIKKAINDNAHIFIVELNMLLKNLLFAVAVILLSAMVMPGRKRECGFDYLYK